MAYSRIVEELGLESIITPTQARKKWSNLLQKYLDIKGGVSTATPDWPHYQMLDQIVPLIRKEKVKRSLSSSTTDTTTSTLRDLDTGSYDPLNTHVVEIDPLAISPEPLVNTSVNEAIQGDITDPSSVSTVGSMSAGLGQSASAVGAGGGTVEAIKAVLRQSITSTIQGGDECKTEVIDDEPPRKRSRGGRRAAQRARYKWWGAVEDEDLGFDTPSKNDRPSTSSSNNKERGPPPPPRTPLSVLEPTQLEMKTMYMLESCSLALGEIRDVLVSRTAQQEATMQNLQETVVQQGNMVKELLTTLTTQNTTLISIISQLANNSIHNKGESLGELGSCGGQYMENKNEGKLQPHQMSPSVPHNQTATTSANSQILMPSHNHTAMSSVHNHLSASPHSLSNTALTDKSTTISTIAQHDHSITEHSTIMLPLGQSSTALPTVQCSQSTTAIPHSHSTTVHHSHTITALPQSHSTTVEVNQHPTPPHQLLASQSNLISDCDDSLVDNSELDDNMAGL